jgi:hypothetical protein
MSTKIYLTQVSGGQIVQGAVGDHIELINHSGATWVRFSGTNSGDYDPSAFTVDTGTPQEYTQLPKITVRFTDPFHNNYVYSLQNVGDKIVWAKTLGNLVIEVWVAGTSHTFPATYLQSDPSSACGTA